MSAPRRFIPTLQEARSLDAVSRLNSVSAAARELNLSQPTVSYHISKLEERWNTKLFRVKGRNLEPTEFLRAIIPEVRTVTHQLEHIGHLVGSQYHQKVLSIGIAPSLASIVLQPRLAAFLKRSPDINVRICAANRFVNLEEERIDVALRLLPRPHSQGAEASGNALLPVPREHMRVVCAPDYLASLTAELQPTDKPDVGLLCQAQLIHEDETVHWANYFAAFLAGHPFETRPRLTFNNADMILQAAISGQGFALLRDVYVMGALRKGSLVEPFDTRLPCERVFQFVAPEAIGYTQPASRFVSWFGAELKTLLGQA
ncbi:LysR substrate-binding domain-containing protein [Thalassobius sp. MITS945101]|uniref:LysR substrate-binding domain-containing protein n=1 Tax=Thalassobius sp. MITS945101 TaxID=3096994 RepID=UPI00399B23C4